MLEYTRVVAIDETLSVRWRSEHIAVDVLVSCGMDPPGELDAHRYCA